MKRFSLPQIYLHWLTLILIALVYAAMEFRGIFPKGSPAYLFMRTTHYSLGVLVWGILFIRVGLRHIYPNPAILPPPPKWQEQAAKLMYIALYLLFLSLPILGVAIMYIGGKPWDIFGISMPITATPNFALKHDIKEIHETLADLGYFLIAGHASAALFHHYILKDNTLKLMMPSKE